MTEVPLPESMSGERWGQQAYRLHIFGETPVHLLAGLDFENPQALHIQFVGADADPVSGDTYGASIPVEMAAAPNRVSRACCCLRCVFCLQAQIDGTSSPVIFLSTHLWPQPPFIVSSYLGVPIEWPPASLNCSLLERSRPRVATFHMRQCRIKPSQQLRRLHQTIQK